MKYPVSVNYLKEASPSPQPAISRIEELAAGETTGNCVLYIHMYIHINVCMHIHETYTHVCISIYTCTHSFSKVSCTSCLHARHQQLATLRPSPLLRLLPWSKLFIRGSQRDYVIKGPSGVLAMAHTIPHMILAIMVKTESLNSSAVMCGVSTLHDSDFWAP